jgi:hypothetical protein
MTVERGLDGREVLVGAEKEAKVALPEERPVT